ncbi:hypothetical protein ACN28I_07815 [Archangium gephyra]|uniref:hypothetical protein n=1 Tax=Archangium gephyra TaxID=48 RepID=UPI003B7FB0F1
MMHPMRSSALLAIALWGVACTTPVEEPGSTLPGRCQVDAPLISAQKTDLLFVIDNSGSMAEEQAAIATELPRVPGRAPAGKRRGAGLPRGGHHDVGLPERVL